MKAAVLYCGTASDGSWEDVYSRLEQSILLNFSVEALDSANGYDLSGYDVVYPDSSVMNAPNALQVKDDLVRYTENGGAVFLTNCFWNFFSTDYFGVRSFEKINACPVKLTFPEAGGDLGEIQTILSDFSQLYTQFDDFGTLSQYDYGYGAKVSHAVPLAKFGNLSLYTVNRYGDGTVFFTNPLLPNPYAVTGFSMLSRNEKQLSLSNTAASCNQLLENGFADYIAKQKYGYSISRVFGCFGRPGMCWELHYEEITGIQNGAGIIFGELCKEYGQVPSYSLIRNAYWWFLRAESITYLLGSGSSRLSYSMDFHENAYSSGAHIAAGGEWLSLCQIQDAGSYFVDYPQYDQRAYPCLTDFNGDGKIDIVSGSSDGKFYYFEGRGYTDRLHTAKAKVLTDARGHELKVYGYSAPTAADVNGDGVLDIVSGASDGKIYWFSGKGRLSFEFEGLLCGAIMDSQSLPDVGDLNGDGCPDLAVGSNSGRLSVWYGDSASSLHVTEGTAILESSGMGPFLAPRIADLNGDGRNDLAIGTREGYIMQMLQQNGELLESGYLTGDEMNYLGNSNIKFGNNCVPFFADINADGRTDLIAGSLEYGLAYPIDSEYFPYPDELQKTLDYIRENDLYLSLHFYTNSYASRQRELYEIAAHRRAMEDRYGISMDQAIGTNHHTWYSSTLSQTQSLLDEWEGRLLWNSGFMPAGSKSAPQTNAHNVVSLPFFLLSNGAKTILVQNCSTLLYGGADWAAISARYDMPIGIYYHCDFVYRDNTEARASLQAAKDFRDTYAYNPVMENQMMLATAAAYNLNVSVEASESGFSIHPSAMSSDFPLYSEKYQGCCGAKISFSESVNTDTLTTDADVWYRNGNDLYIALNRSVRVYEAADAPQKVHIEQINIPAEVELTGSGATVTFLDGGMMMLVASGAAATEDGSWSVSSQNGKTIFTKYGQAGTLSILF
jgi:hypothetical protein